MSIGPLAWVAALTTLATLAILWPLRSKKLVKASKSRRTRIELFKSERRRPVDSTSELTTSAGKSFGKPGPLWINASKAVRRIGDFKFEIVLLATLCVAVAPFANFEHLGMIKWPLLLAVVICGFSIARRGSTQPGWTLPGSARREHVSTVRSKQGPLRFACILAILASVIFLAAFRFDGSFAWLTVGFPTDRYYTLTMGPASNIPAILGEAWGLRIDDVVGRSWIDSTLAPSIAQLDRVLNNLTGLWLPEWTLTLRRGLQLMTYLFMLLAALGVARCSRSGGVNVLFGVVAWWAVVFAFMPQMHERYLMWAAAMSSVLCVTGVAGIATFLLLTIASFEMQYVTMIFAAGSPVEWRPLFGLLVPLNPWVGWAIATCAIALVLMSNRTRDGVQSLGPNTTHASGREVNHI